MTQLATHQPTMEPLTLQNPDAPIVTATGLSFNPQRSWHMNGEYAELKEQMLALEPGAHLCLFYEHDPAEQMPALVPFIQAGLAQHEQCFYVADDQTIEQVAHALAADGISVHAEVARQALQLWTRREWRQAGALDIEQKTVQVLGLIEAARAAGFDGIRFAIEMTWTLRPEIEVSQLKSWEAVLNEVLASDFPTRMVCQYNRQRLSPLVMQAALRTHPHVILGHQVYPSLFYEAPLITNGKSEAEKLNWMIAQLEQARTAEKAREALIRQLRESEERFRLLIKQVIDYAIYMLDPEGRIVSWNMGAERLKCYTADEIIGQHFSRFFTPEDVERQLPERLLQRATREGHVEHEGWRVRKDGSRFWADAVITAVRDEQGNLRGFAKVTRDMTERKQAAEQLLNAKEQLRLLAGHLQSAREHERRTIAREIHDELGQQLTALKIDLRMLERKMTKPNAPLSSADAAVHIEAMTEMIDHTLESMRHLVRKLRPEVLDDLGLLAAIEWQAQEFQSRTGVQCHLRADVESLALDSERSIALFRILQEALTNVARHANASQVDISLRQESGQLVLEVRDNGRGISESAPAAKQTFGLLGMKERATLLGGAIAIGDGPERGTRVWVQIPT